MCWKCHLFDRLQSAFEGLRQPFCVIANQQMVRRFVFFNLCKSSNRFAKNIVGFVVIHCRDFTNQHITTVPPKGVPVTRAQCNTFTG